MLKINNLHASVAEKKILNGINLTINPGEIHAIMGPNGSGKSTLANVLAGNETYTINAGEIYFQDASINNLAPEERATKGIFLAFQYPVEIPGVNNMVFLKTALNSLRKQRGEPEIDAIDFLSMIRGTMAALDMDETFLHRAVNEGFSGGEKKRNEILQLLTLNPRLAILDETDSGLDIDALQTVAKGVNTFHNKQNAVIVVTHYQRLLDYIVPDYVHILANGKIIKTGDKNIAKELEKTGYGFLEKEAQAA